VSEQQRLATILWRGKWLIVLAAAVGVGLAILITRTSSKVYEATAVLQVTASGASNANNFNPLDIQSASQNLATTYAKLLTDPSFLAEIGHRIEGGKYSPGELQAKIKAGGVQGTGLIDLHVREQSPAAATRLAREVVAQFLALVQRQQNAQSQKLQSQLQKKISAFTDQIAALARAGGAKDPGVAEQLATLRGARAGLIQQQQQLLALGLLAGGNLALAAPPHAGGSPVSPRPVLNIIAGVLVGLLAGSALAYLRARRDRGLHSSGEAEELLGVPILAAVPVRRRFAADDAVLGEAYDVLRANLAFISLDSALQVLTFSSYNPREGKTSTVTGLAYAALRGGINVVVIDGDVRTRSLSSRLGHEDSPGLTNVVVGMTPLSDAVVQIAPGLSLLPAGPIPPNPPSLLGSSRMAEILDDLRDDYSLILIDSPPVAHLADASILASVSDGVVVIARVGVTDREDLPSAAAKLRHSPTPIVGVVVLEPRTVDSVYYPARAKSDPLVDPAETF
jgi:capsular exopolysaccharide synthesis family protein